VSTVLIEAPFVTSVVEFRDLGVDLFTGAQQRYGEESFVDTPIRSREFEVFGTDESESINLDAKFGRQSQEWK
jgi:hypothetical protein